MDNCKNIDICIVRVKYIYQSQGMSGVFFNKGENCIAAGRLFVEESIHDAFVEKVVSLKIFSLFL